MVKFWPEIFLKFGHKMCKVSENFILKIAVKQQRITQLFVAFFTLFSL